MLRIRPAALAAMALSGALLLSPAASFAVEGSPAAASGDAPVATAPASGFNYATATAADYAKVWNDTYNWPTSMSDDGGVTLYVANDLLYTEAARARQAEIRDYFASTGADSEGRVLGTDGQKKLIPNAHLLLAELKAGAFVNVPASGGEVSYRSYSANTSTNTDASQIPNLFKYGYTPTSSGYPTLLPPGAAIVGDFTTGTFSPNWREASKAEKPVAREGGNPSSTTTDSATTGSSQPGDASAQSGTDEKPSTDTDKKKPLTMDEIKALKVDVTGFVYVDKNDTRKYEDTVDVPLSGVEFGYYEDFELTTPVLGADGKPLTATTGKDGRFEFKSVPNYKYLGVNHVTLLDGTVVKRGDKEHRINGINLGFGVRQGEDDLVYFNEFSLDEDMLTNNAPDEAQSDAAQSGGAKKPAATDKKAPQKPGVTAKKPADKAKSDAKPGKGGSSVDNPKLAQTGATALGAGLLAAAAGGLGAGALGLRRKR